MIELAPIAGDIARAVVSGHLDGPVQEAVDRIVVDDHMRPLFAFLRALPVPTSLFAAPDDWASPSFTRRIERAAGELAHLVDSGIRTTLAGRDGYRHRFAGNATRSPQSADDVDFDTDLMRLATGGASRKDAT